MTLNNKFLIELQRRLKIGNRRGVHLNAIPGNSRYKFDLNRLSHIDKSLPKNFINALLSQQNLKFKISWKENVPDLNTLFEDEQINLVKITKAFEILINQTEAIEAEKGINTFGFGFPIIARRDKADNLLTVAPIIIWSLKIKRTKEFNTWEVLRNEEDPIYINEVLINHIQNDANIKIEQIESEILEDGLLVKNELIKICVDLIKTLNTISSPDVEEIFRKKIEDIVSIGDKKHYEKLPLNSTNSLIDFGGLFSIFEVQKQNIIKDYEDLIELSDLNLNGESLLRHSFQSLSSIETDPSQQSVLHALETKKNILIQGPPGTGKSQTLTAILVNALENCKKTIVVCEKRTALEVLHNALIEKGLINQCILIKDVANDRKIVVESVRERVSNPKFRHGSHNYSKDSLNIVLRKTKEQINIINKKHLKLDEKLIGSNNWTDVVGNILSKIRENNDNLKLNFDKYSFNYSTQEYDYWIDILERGENIYANYVPYKINSFLNPFKLTGDNPYLLEKAIKDDFDNYTNKIKQIKQLIETAKIEYFEYRTTDFRNQILSIKRCIKNVLSKEKKIIELISKSKNEYESCRKNEFNKQIKSISQIIIELDNIFFKNKNNADITCFKKTNNISYKLLSVFSNSKKQTINAQNELLNTFHALQENLKIFKDFFLLIDKINVDDIEKSITTLKSEVEKIKKEFNDKVEKEFNSFKANDLLYNFDNIEFFNKIQLASKNSNNSQELNNTLLSIQNLLHKIISETKNDFKILSNELAFNKDIKIKCLFEQNYFKNVEIIETISKKIEITEKKFELKIKDEFNINNLLKQSKIQISSFDLIKQKLKEIKEQIIHDNWVLIDYEGNGLYDFFDFFEKINTLKNNFFEDSNDLFIREFNWFKFYNSLRLSDREIVNQLLNNQNWKRNFLTNYLNSLLLKNASTDLPTNDEELKTLNNSFSGFEKEQLKFIKDFWFSRQIESIKRFENKKAKLNVENIYNKRSSNRFKRLSLRQIIQYDIDFFTDFFPIILTTPDVSSNLFKGMNGYFDIVMFDEASQLRLEDNLPSIFKGKQIIIAGDEHQMPPSNFFSKVFDGLVEDEEELEEENEFYIDQNDILLSCESLLDFGTELKFNKQYLDFHYRSKHPFLIDFSNYAFYNQRLKPLPNNFDYVPIKYVQVNGTFSDHTNEAEAEMVLSIIDLNINRLPNGKYPTIGVATFNITQRDLIKNKISERQKLTKYEEFNAKIRELEENGFFIKNLENIQGDERDVIILSTTYGISKDGKVSERFGPINHSKGYKLLNVIITRAKYKLYCVTSIPESKFLSYKDYLITDGSNIKSGKASFFAYLAYCKSVSESDHSLRLAILKNLADNTTRSADFGSFKSGDLESPFEEEVYQCLADCFGTGNLIPQFKYAGFRIDIVYESKIVGVPKIAIECDGAKYHSSREAYLYDKHRQNILEKHGFIFHRIWSTNWWRNQKKEIANLIEFIKIAESNSKVIIDKKTPLAFTDDVLKIENYILEISSNDDINKQHLIKELENDNLIETNDNLPEEKIKINSKVKIKYLNSNKNIDIHIISGENNKNILVNGVQRIFYKLPLAQSIIGKTVGCVVKIDNTDSVVKILEINNSSYEI
uniref:AAA domain-containing protein n=1 Tax=Flavobacterium sp. TaxID=239 RepID=UPI004049A50C